MSEALQYTLVAIIVLGALVWIVVKSYRKKSGKSRGGCCGCSLSSTCNSKDKGKNPRC